MSLSPSLLASESPPPEETLSFPQGTMSSDLLSNLQARDCISFPDPSAPSLTNPIYPLFSARNFAELSKKEYAFIEPSLRLASRFVTDETMMPFWTRVHHGEIATEWRSGEEVRFYKDSEHTSDAEDSEKEDAKDKADKARKEKETRSALGKIARHLKIVSMSKSMAKEHNDAIAEAFLEGSDFRIGMHPNVKKYITTTSADKEADVCETMRFQLLLTRTLIREIVHLFYYHTHKDSVLFAEPFWDADEQDVDAEEADLGGSWELFAFACKLNSFPALAANTPAKSLFLHTKHTVETGVDTLLTHTTILPMDWINKWFLQSTWDHIHEEGRTEGRSQIGSAPVLAGTDIEGEEDRFHWVLEKYDHVELARHGGFQTGNEDDVEWLYGRLGGAEGGVEPDAEGGDAYVVD
ncbi:hypothetical protein K491DRAFT_486007 [Lophiostoma macrostomum CBS 122681]|uniref:Uncharacterized protein n=1 Tax=Lophiostoma macrostomum CBS 122681 TaxID=1314788 RepID=A0A6A6T5L2_9PLEO|nr:hypothetical protein K491DRAFT_486007 [Lophiostoma macrostomum CBS 122681]